MGKGLTTVLMCVLMLGLVLEQVQVEGRFCCKGAKAKSCFNDCRVGPKICAVTCGCEIRYFSKCPSGYTTILNFLPNVEKPDRIEYCSLGCRSIMCDNMYNVDGGDEMMKINSERCGDACDRFCNGDASFASAAV